MGELDLKSEKGQTRLALPESFRQPRLIFDHFDLDQLFQFWLRGDFTFGLPVSPVQLWSCPTVARGDTMVMTDGAQTSSLSL